MTQEQSEKSFDYFRRCLDHVSNESQRGSTEVSTLTKNRAFGVDSVDFLRRICAGNAHFAPRS